MSSLPASGWRLPDDACALLAQLVQEHQPELIVECGSGRSTIVMGEALRENGHGKVFALEHDRDFVLETAALIYEHVGGWSKVNYAPLEACGLNMLAPEWYARSGWDDLRGIGMLVVDGPPGGSSPYARAPAVPLLRDRLLPGCVVVLDDINRRQEQTIWREWGIEGTIVEHAKASLVYGTLP